MKLAGLLSCFCCVALAIGRLQHEREWRLWKSQYNRQYSSEREQFERHLVWLANRKYVLMHNANNDTHGYCLALNQLADMTDHEHAQMLAGPANTEHAASSDMSVIFTDLVSSDLPASIDWRTKGVVSSVKNQGVRQCNSSYAFASVGALEGAWALAKNKLTKLSEQNVIDCSVPYGNMGCAGGSVFNSFLYMINNGVDTTSCYPYKGRQSYCKYQSNCTGAKMSGVVRIEFGNETDLQAALATVGPISVTIDGSSKAFRFYSQGVFDWSGCSSTKLNHPLLLIGYGTATVEGVETDYWLLKNSYGTNWGESGYFRLVRNKFNLCGIASDALFPTL